MLKAYKNIVKDTHTQLRISVADSFLSGNLDLKFVNNLADKLIESNPELDAIISKEKLELLSAISSKSSTSDLLNLKIPEVATLWGAGLAYISKDCDIQKTDLWEKITASDALIKERNECCYELYRSFRKIGFDEFKVTLNPPKYPDIGYYCNLKDKVVNLDPVWMLILGIEKSRAAMMHEVAHAIGTIAFTPKMQSLRDEIKKIGKPDPFKNTEEYIKQALLNLEWKNRFYMADECENSYANRFMANRGKTGSEDYGTSMNYIEATFGGIQQAAEKVTSNDGNISSTDYFFNLKRAIRYSFFKNNDFFNDTREDWRKIGVEPDWIENGKLSGWDALQEVCLECRKLEELQPDTGDMVFGGEYFSKKNYSCWEQRVAIMDEIFDEFALKYTKDMQKELEQNIRQQIEQAQEQEQNQEPDDNNSESSDNSEPSENNDNENNEGQSEQESSSDGESSEQESNGQENPTDSKNSTGNDSSEIEENIDPSENDENQAGGNPSIDEKTPDEGAEESEDNLDNQDAKSESNNELDDEENKDGSPDDSNKADDNLPEIETPPETPQDSQILPEESNEEDTDKTSDQTIKEILDELKKEKEDQKQNEDNNDQKQPEQPITNSQFTGNQDPVNLSEVKNIIDLNEYDKAILPFKQTISSVSKIFKKMRELNISFERSPSKKRKLLPQKGGISAYDRAKRERTLKKAYNGEALRLDDFKQFKTKQKNIIQGADINIEILLDISGSLDGAPLDTALATACSLYEAASKEEGVNVNITAMGQPTPIAIARMGQSSTEISKNILKIRQISGSAQDFLSPALKDVFQRYENDSKNEPNKSITGKTHVFVVSDGYFSDEELAVYATDDVINKCKHTSMDFILMSHPHDHQGPQILNLIKNNSLNKRIGCKQINEISEIHDALIDLTKSRLKSLKNGMLTTAIKLKENKNILSNWRGYKNGR